MNETRNLTEKQKKNVKTNKVVLKVFGIIVGLVFALIVSTALVGGDDSPTAAPEKANKPAAAAKAKVDEPKEKPKETEEPAVEAEPTNKEKVSEAVGEEVDGAVVTKESKGKTYVIEFPVTDNMSPNLIRHGADNDTKDIVAAVVNTGAPVKSVTVHGTYPLADAYGNTEDGRVILTFWDAPTLKKVNWNDTLLLDPELAADIYEVHPELRR